MKALSFHTVIGGIWIYIVAVGLNMAFPTLAIAEELFALSGLSFDCGECRLQSEEPCEVLLGETARSLDCAEAVTQLLKDTLRSGYGEKPTSEQRPTPGELRRFLMTEAPGSDAATEAIKLLLASEIGRKALIQDAYLFASKYPSELAASVTRKPEASDVWSAYWALPSREGMNLDTKFRAALVRERRELNETDLFTDLTVVNPEQDQKDLLLYEESLRETRPGLAKSVAQVRAFLERCQQSLLEAKEADGCSSKEADVLTPAGARFVQKVQMQRLVGALKSGALGAEDALKRLNRSNYREFRTPAVHEMMIAILETGRTGDSALRKRLLGLEYQGMLQIFAQNDRVIAHRYAQLLCQRASALLQGEGLEKKDVEQAFQLVEQSYEVLKEPFDERSRLVEAISLTPEWYENDELQKRFTSLLATLDAAHPWYELSQEKSVGLFALLSGLTFIWMMYTYSYRQNTLAADQLELERLAEQQEYLELRDYFGLSELDGEPALTKSYRKKAKETHPDVQGSESTEFHELNAKYTRAKALFLKRVVTDPDVGPPESEPERG